MQLVNRVSAFHLGALLIALVGYSVAMYFSARYYLYSEFDDRLQGALQILAASVEIESDDVTWNPAEYTLEFDEEILRDVRWAVANEHGEIIDHSPQLSPARAMDNAVLSYARTSRPRNTRIADIGPWRIVQQRLFTPHPKPVEDREPDEFESLVITVARSHTELDATMSRVTSLVWILPVVVWLIAVVSGRAYVRRSLLPLTAMAERAKSMRKPDFGLRLPVDSAQGELHELGASFNRLLDQLQEAFERERRFTGDAAHQLRTPLTVLQGHIEVAQRRPRTPEEYQQTLSVLAANVGELRQIVDSLLFLARSETDAPLPKTDPLLLSQWLPEYVERWKNHPRSSDLIMVTEGQSYVAVSVPLLIQLLDNLVDNALKCSTAGTPVRLEVGCRSGEAYLEVQDQGMGIDDAERDAVFQPFFRSTSARQRGAPGLGLGLSIARRIARSMGGDLTCHRRSGAGMAFRLTLPLVPENEVV